MGVWILIYTNVTVIEFWIHPNYWIWDNIIELYDLSFIKNNGGVAIHVIEDLLNMVDEKEGMEILME